MGYGNASKKLSKNLGIAPWLSWPEINRAERAIKFIETYCTLTKGYGSGKRIRLAEFQKTWLRKVLALGISSACLSIARGNGKSSFLAALALWALFDPDPAIGSPQVIITAVTMGQAIRAVYGVALAMVNAEPELQGRSIAYSGIGSTRLAVPFNGGELIPLANDPAGLQGLDPSFVVCDEIGFQSIVSWNSLLQASMKRSSALVIGIGTPGLDRTNALWHLRHLVTEGQIIPGFIFTEYAADHGTKVDDMEQWHKANPALAEGFMNLEALKTNLSLVPEGHFRLFHLGQWVDGVDSWLGADGRTVWEGLKDMDFQFIDGAATWIGIDVGLKRDSTAVAAVQYKPDGKLHVRVKIWVPKKDEPVDITDVMEYIRKLCDKYRVGAISFDPRFFDVPAKMLFDDGYPVIEIPQSVERMTGIIGQTYELIMTGGLSHDGDELFTTQVLNAVSRYNERGFTLQKQKSRGRIDAAIALSLAIDRAQHKKKPRAKLVIL